MPKAEALTCLRSLLVQMRSFKVDMLCVMIEQMGPFLYRSADAHSKMSVIMQVLKEKSQNVKDPRQKVKILKYKLITIWFRFFWKMPILRLFHPMINRKWANQR